MGASQFVGRVGGLAVALGVGVAVFNGVGTAWADSGSSDSGSRTSSAAHTGSSNAGPSRAARRAGATSASAVKSVKNSAAAPAGAAVSVVASTAATGSDGSGTGSLPVGDLLASTAVAVSRRHPSAAVTARSATASSTAQAITSGGITVNPVTELFDGIVIGTLNATSATGQTLKYSFLNASNGGKMDIGVVPFDAQNPNVLDPQSYVAVPYGTWVDPNGVKGTEVFNVRVTEVTAFDTFIAGIPLIGTLAAPIISLLQQTPFLGNLLAPIIGSTVVAPVSVNVAALAPGDTPVDFTYDVISFDGTKISTQFFPASGLAAGATAPTLLNPPGLGAAGATNTFSTNAAAGSTPGIQILRTAQPQIPGDVAYNVVTWDPRGEFDSGGILQLDNPMYEGRDTSAVLTWAANNTPATLNGPNDPVVGMIGGSYGGGIQMTTVDPRIEAIVPTIAWNSLNESLYPDNVFKTAWATTLGLSLLTTGARVNGEIYPALLSGDLLGSISETAQAVLGSSGPTALLNVLQAPALFVQGTVDALFPLQESLENIQAIQANPFGTPTKLIWYCGGHGVCLDQTQEQLTAQAATVFGYDKLWLNKWVAGQPIPDAAIPNFQWWDQTGTRYTSNLFPFSDGFNTDTLLTGVSTGGVLGILPFAIGGSGPNSSFSFPLNATFATKAGNAINVPITGITEGDQVVGAPTVSFTYSGVGTAKAVYAQIVDNVSGRVLGNIVTQVPVTLDGQSRTVSVPIADIAYTATTVNGAAPSLTLQITSSATLYWNSAWGVVNISNVSTSLPVKA